MSGKTELIAYCGLYCGSCFGYQGKVADLARDLRKELRSHRFDLTAKTLAEYDFFKIFADYAKCYEVLGAMVKMRCKKGCRNGGGPPFCKMRKCSQKKGYEGCWECDDFESCKHLDILRANHGIAHIKNLRALKKKGVDKFLEGKQCWYAKEK